MKSLPCQSLPRPASLGHTKPRLNDLRNRHQLKESLPRHAMPGLAQPCLAFPRLAMPC